jgi:signal recognition particle GTPase
MVGGLAEHGGRAGGQALLGAVDTGRVAAVGQQLGQFGKQVEPRVVVELRRDLRADLSSRLELHAAEQVDGQVEDLVVLHGCWFPPDDVDP